MQQFSPISPVNTGSKLPSSSIRISDIASSTIFLVHPIMYFPHCSQTDFIKQKLDHVPLSAKHFPKTQSKILTFLPITYKTLHQRFSTQVTLESSRECFFILFYFVLNTEACYHSRISGAKAWYWYFVKVFRVNLMCHRS